MNQDEQEEDIIYWQDVLDSIAAGRAEGLACPFCKVGHLVVDKAATGGRGLKVSCPNCKKFIEGSLGGGDAEDY